MKDLTIFILILCSLGFYSACDNGKNKTADNQTENQETPIISADERVAARDLWNEPLYIIPEPDSSLAKKDAALTQAKEAYNEEPSLENAVWYGRRMAYRGYYYPAISTFSEAIRNFPDSPELYRHRGHRYITTRQFRKAELDLERAASLAEGKKLTIEADGIPNRLNQPLSNLHFNIYYHLGLSRYLQGKFSEAKEAYTKCMEYSVNEDLKVATTYWGFLTHRKLGELEAANDLLEQQNTSVDLVENTSYLKLIKLYKNEIDAEEIMDEKDKLDLATLGYGVAQDYHFSGNKNKAEEVLQKILESGYWTAFGYIAAEAEIKRMEDSQ